MGGKWVHRLTEINEQERTAVCAECGPVTIRRQSGGVRWRCNEADRDRYRYRKAGNRKPYRRNLGKSCERCGFVPEHPRQMDVHHRDGDHSNDDPANLQTLCANCHRLVHIPGFQ